MSQWCDTCGAFKLWGNSHRCPPTWEVWCEEIGGTEDDARTVHATDAQEAVEKWALESDRHEEYEILDHGAERVMVRAEDGVVSEWTVTGHSEPVYQATEAKT